MTKEETVKETPKEIFLKDYKPPDYAFEKVNFHDCITFVYVL
jgi:aminopeptidase N